MGRTLPPANNTNKYLTIKLSLITCLPAARILVVVVIKLIAKSSCIIRTDALQHRFDAHAVIYEPEKVLP